MNRHILVRNRKVECVGPRELVQNGIASETVTLGLDQIGRASCRERV